MINQEDKQTVMTFISEACKSGARKSKASELVGLTVRTIQRWTEKGPSDNRKGSRAVPGNKLSDDEKIRIINVLESPEFADSNPNQIVPKLADQGMFLVHYRNPGPVGQVRVQRLCHLCDSLLLNDQVVPTTKDQGVTDEPISKVITNDLALPVSHCVGTEVQV